VTERVGGCRRPQRTDSNLEAECGRVGAHQLVDTVRRNRLSSRPVVLLRTGIALSAAGRIQKFVNTRIGVRM